MAVQAKFSKLWTSLKLNRTKASESPFFIKAHRFMESRPTKFHGRCIENLSIWKMMKSYTFQDAAKSQLVGCWSFSVHFEFFMLWVFSEYYIIGIGGIFYGVKTKLIETIALKSTVFEINAKICEKARNKFFILFIMNDEKLQNGLSTWSFWNFYLLRKLVAYTQTSASEAK